MKTMSCAGIVVLMLLLSGCAVNGTLRAEQARQEDFSKLYIESLRKTYGTFDEKESGLHQRLRIYDEMEAQRPKIEQEARNADKVQLEVLNKELGAISEQIQGYQRDAAIGRVEAKKLAAQIAALPKQTSTKPDQGLLDRAQKVQTEKDLNDERLALTEAALSDAKKRLADQQERIKNLQERDYVIAADKPRREYRNRIINDFLAIADFNYYEFKSVLLVGRANGDTLLDVAELSLSTATTLVGGVTSKTNLGAASTLLKGGRTSVDKNFFVQQTMASIINGIEIRRQTDKIEILKKMAQTTDQYPLSHALSDVQLYQSRASLVAGAMAVANETADKASSSEKALRMQQTVE